MADLPLTDLRHVYASRLRQHGQYPKDVVRVLPPLDTGREIEVLYLDRDGDPCTAYFLDGDNPPAPLICAGW